jgi:uncharacterized protein
MLLDPEILLLLLLIAAVAGWIDAIAGGGGIIILPSLLLAGLNPVQALATNKLQACFGSGTATLNFVLKKKLDVRAVWPAILCTFVGAALGTLAVQWMPKALLETLIPLLLIALALFLLFGTRHLASERQARIRTGTFALLIGGGVGFYDGFFGPGTGTLFAVAHMLLLGQSMLNATINTKLLNFVSNITALLFFILGGEVQWLIGLVMALGQMLGAWLGSNMVLNKGARLIRPVMIVVSIVISLKLLLFSD